MKRFVLYICFLSILIPCIDNKPSIRENFFNDEIIGFYLSSIDLESGESSTLLFDYAIDLCDGQDTELILKYDVSMFMPIFNDQIQEFKKKQRFYIYFKKKRLNTKYFSIFFDETFPSGI